MFPLEFPMAVLRRANRNSIVFDPFCGRGTTNFAAQTYRMKSYGIDASPIATAIAKAKLASTDVESVMALLEEAMQLSDVETPKGEFWRLAFHSKTLQNLCKLRRYLIMKNDTDTIVMLRAIAIGCLHGPLTKNLWSPSYFSNQMPRTFSSKPNYSVKYWKKNNLYPRYVDIRIPIKKKAEAVLKYIDISSSSTTNIVCADSRKNAAYEQVTETIDLVITSPPYYGMKTYVQDQWLRNWFIGGREQVDYDMAEQLSHSSPEYFCKSLSEVWNNISNKASDDINLVIRFGGLRSRRNDFDDIIRRSFDIADEDWAIYYSRGAGSSRRGKRQAATMGDRVKSSPIDEKDYFVRIR